MFSSDTNTGISTEEIKKKDLGGLPYHCAAVGGFVSCCNTLPLQRQNIAL